MARPRIHHTSGGSAHVPLCGRWYDNPRISGEENEITCTICLRKIVARVRRQRRDQQSQEIQARRERERRGEQEPVVWVT